MRVVGYEYNGEVFCIDCANIEVLQFGTLIYAGDTEVDDYCDVCGIELGDTL